VKLGWISACVVFAGMAAAVWGAAQGESQPTVSLLYTATSHYEPLAWLRGGERFAGGAH
jgi:hypothetical protein